MNAGEWLAALDGRVELVSVLWLLPIIFMFHDFEEILTVEGWLSRNGDRVFAKLPGFARRLLEDSFRMNTRQFAADVLQIFSVIAAAAAAAVFFGFYWPYLVILAIFFLHVFTHAGQAVLLRMYTPGVATAVLLVLPFSLYSYYKLLESGIVHWDDLFLSLLLAVLAVPPLLWLLVRDRRKAVRGY